MVSSDAQGDINIAFMVVYVPFLALNMFNLICQARGMQRLAYFSLVIFDQVRIVADALLVAAFETEKDSSTASKAGTINSLYTGGYVMQSIGYSMLFSATLWFYDGAIRKDYRERIHTLPIQFLHLVNILSTVLLIVGITGSASLFNADEGAGGSVKPIAKAGSYLYCFLTAVLGLLIIYKLFIRKVSEQSARTILAYCLAAIFFLCIRVGYSTYRIQESQLTNYNVWAHLVCQDLVECFVVIIFTVLAFTVTRTESGNSVQSDSDCTRSPHEDAKEIGFVSLEDSTPVMRRA
ncbi:hypothetical protein CBS101457_001322 [Exobasidium rhododendri]|nr:hypothetical protein CBS101457_001322 [Exobasidium rhododendri]